MLDNEIIKLSHGGGGRLMHQLIRDVFLESFDNVWLRQLHDATEIETSSRTAVTTDSYVIKPLFFPGGDIGSLAVYGTANDLLMAGAIPRYLTSGFVIEEGFAMKDLRRIVASMKRALEHIGMAIVAGDTKVVDRGKGDGLYINTTGVGTLECPQSIKPSSVRLGDIVLVSGDLGRHGIAVMASREDLSFETKIESDCAYLGNLVHPLLKAGIEIHCLRDATRGGLATCLNEIAETASVGIEIRENAIPVSEEVEGACEILGLDPLYVANEGRMIAMVPESSVNPVMSLWRKTPGGERSAIIGRVVRKGDGVVWLESVAGTKRILDMLSGEQLPRIC